MNSITVIIIIAVVVAVALGYAFWIESVASGEIYKASGSVCPPRLQTRATPLADKLRIDVTVANTCSVPLTISYVLVNGKPAENVKTPIVLGPGQAKTISLLVPRSPGRVYRVTLHTARDYNYVLLVRSP